MDRTAIEALFEHWARGDMRYGLDLFAPDMHFTAAQPEGQVEATGPDGVMEFMRGFLPQWDLYTVELDKLEERGDGRFMAVGTQRAIGRESGMSIDAPAYIAISVRGGEIAQLEFHFRREPAEAALDEFA